MIVESGKVKYVTVCEAEAVQLLASVTVTVNVVSLLVVMQVAVELSDHR